MRLDFRKTRAFLSVPSPGEGWQPGEVGALSESVDRPGVVEEAGRDPTPVLGFPMT